MSASPGNRHLVLLGDSIFDNGPYVPTENDTTSSQLRRALAKDWQVSLLAVDGHLTRDVERQLPELPADATHLIVSAGGNDALQVAARWGLLENQRFGAVQGNWRGTKNSFAGNTVTCWGRCWCTVCPMRCARCTPRCPDCPRSRQRH